MSNFSPLTDEVCPLCRATTKVGPGRGDWFDIDCLNCGKFSISGSLDSQFKQEEPNSRFLLRGAIRAATLNGEPVRLERRLDVEALEKRCPSTVDGRAKHLLRMLSMRMEHPASVFEFNFEVDYPLAFARNASEFDYYFDLLKEQGLVEITYQRLPRTGVRLTAAGWRQIEAEKTAGVESDQAFVAMWFAPEMNDAYLNGIGPAVEDAGFKPLRIDAKAHNGKICDHIIAEIRASRFLVADFTGSRGGVYFEAGFAMGLGIPVVWLCRGDDVGNLHFDTRQYNHILWETPEDIRKQLADRIRATIGRGGFKR